MERYEKQELGQNKKAMPGYARVKWEEGTSVRWKFPYETKGNPK